MPLHTVTLARPALVFLFALSLLWASTLIAVPSLADRAAGNPQLGRTAGLVYLVGSLVCHQRPERSFHPWGVQVPVCARCEGIYLAAPFSIALVLTVRRRGARVLASRWMWRRVILFASLPTILTLVWEWTTGEMTSGMVRATAGFALGAAMAAMVAAVTVGDLR